MKQSRQCSKCSSPGVIRVPASMWNEDNKIPVGLLSMVKTTRYVCLTCGFVEEWVESLEDREKLRQRAETWPQNPPDEGVV